MTQPRTCALEGCYQPALPGRKYCSDEHRKVNARRAYALRRGAPIQDKTALEERLALEGERLRQKELRRTLEELSRTAAKRREYVSAIKEVLQPFEPSEVFPFPEKDVGSEVAWALQLCDWHVGQKTAIEHTGGIYEQTVALTRQQLDRLLSAVSMVFHEANGKHVKTLWVQVDGDIVEGDSMRPAQLRQIEIPVVRQTVLAFDLLSYTLRTLLEMPGLEELIVDVVGGNHDRTTTKAGLAGLGETDYVDTFAWVLGAFLERAFEDDPRVTVKNWDTFFGTREYAGLRHVFEHGASIRTSGGSYGGVPWYPIHNAARQYESMLGGVDMAWFGHLHMPYVIPLGQEGWVVGGGALPATTPFIQSRYKTLRRPMQWLVEFHRKVGATKFEPIYADIDLPRPGVVWTR